MATLSLNQKCIKRLTTTKSSEIFWDSGFSSGAFGIKVTQKGCRTYVLDYRNKRGQQRRITLGSADLLGLAEARRKAETLIVGIHNGKDPLEEKTKYRQSITFRDLCDEYLRLHAIPNKRTSSVKEDARIIEKELVPAWGELKAVDITRKDIIAILDEIHIARRAPVMALRTRALLHTIFRFAMERDFLERTPVTLLPKIPKNNPRTRFLKNEELPVFLSELQLNPGPIANILLMILVTGKRADEVKGMTWSEVKDGVWEIPAHRSKNKRESVSPLPPIAERILQEQRERNRRLKELAQLSDTTHLDTYVFPGRHRGHIRWLNHACRKIVKRMNVKNFTPHDLRRTAVTHMRRMGAATETLKRVLNHNDDKSNVTSIYVRHNEAAEVRTAIFKWAEELEKRTSVKGGSPDSQTIATKISIKLVA